MMGFFSGSNWNDENIKRFDALEAKLERLSSLQNEHISGLQRELSNKEEVINILTDKVGQLEKNNSTINAEKSSLEDELKKFLLCYGNRIQFLNEQTNLLQRNLSHKEEVINPLNNRVDKLEEATNVVSDLTILLNDRMSNFKTMMSNEEEAINIVRNKVNQLEEKSSKAYAENSTVYAKVEKQSTLQEEQIILLQSKLSDKENTISRD